MTLHDYTQSIIVFIRENEAWAAPLVFCLAFGESLAFLSLLLPATVILLAIGGLIGVSGIELSHIVVAGWLGSVAGYGLSYWVGRYYKDAIHNVWPFSRHQEMIPRGEQFFARWGALGVFLGHFFGPLRAVVPVVAGMYAMRQIPFQLANVSSSLIWSVGVLSPGALGARWLSGG